MTAPLAAVFDLDGTIVDTMPFHGEAWAGRRAAEIVPAPLGRPVPSEALLFEGAR